MKLIYEITVFPLISTLSLYLILSLLVEVLIRGQRLTKPQQQQQQQQQQKKVAVLLGGSLL